MISLVAAVKEYHKRVAEAEKELAEAKEKWEAIFRYGYEATDDEIMSAQEVLMEAEMWLDSVKKGF